MLCGAMWPAMQTGVPMTGLAVAGAQFRLKPEDRALLNSRYLPWWGLRAKGSRVNAGG